MVIKTVLRIAALSLYRGRHSVAARIAVSQLQLIFIGVLDAQKLGFNVGDSQRLQPVIAADSVILMYHRFTFMQIGKTVDDAFRVTRFAVFAPPGLPRALAKQLRLGDDADPLFVQLQSMFQG